MLGRICFFSSCRANLFIKWIARFSPITFSWDFLGIFFIFYLNRSPKSITNKNHQNGSFTLQGKFWDTKPKCPSPSRHATFQGKTSVPLNQTIGHILVGSPCIKIPSTRTRGHLRRMPSSPPAFFVMFFGWEDPQPKAASLPFEWWNPTINSKQKCMVVFKGAHDVFFWGFPT